jgi:hypothetical protein
MVLQQCWVHYQDFWQKSRENSSAFRMHCVIHRQAVASKTLHSNPREVLNLAIKVVNYVENSVLSSRLFALLCEDLTADHKVLLFHTEVRWLSKGNMLGRIHELKEAVTLFLEHQGKDQLLQTFNNDSFQLSLAYLADIFEALNTFILKLQGTNTIIIAHYDFIQAFTGKLRLWIQRVGVKNVASFSRLDEAVKGKILENDLKEKIESHLVCLQDEFRRYFPDVVAENPIWNLVRNPFTTDVQSLLEDIQEEFVELKFD